MSPVRPSWYRWLAGLSGPLVLLLGLAFPGTWKEALLRPVEGSLAPSPWGVVLFRICLVLDGLGLLVVAFRVSSRKSRTSIAPVSANEDLGWRELLILAALTATGLFLRLHRIGMDLWLDEIVNLEAFRHVPALRVVSTFVLANNHMLNTLLVKAMASWAGESEWAVRLPAVIFGAATVPALWLAGRRALGTWGTSLAALLLATSYHHVFFSQNARGYSAHVFFAVAATGFLASALRSGAPGKWLLYGLAILGGVASLLHGFFVWAGHALLVAVLWARARGAGGLVDAGLRRGLVVIAGTAYASFHLCALVIPDAVSTVTTVYRTRRMGYGLFSVEHFGEWTRAGLAAVGPGGATALVILAVLGAAGFYSLQKQDGVLAWGLALPLGLMLVFVAAGGLNVTPRTFVLALPLALLSVVAGLLAALAWLERLFGDRAWVQRTGRAVLCVLMTAASLAALGRYYAHPKQDFRGAMRFVESQRRTGDAILPVYLAKSGYRHYAREFGLAEGRDFVVVHSVKEIEDVRRLRPSARLFAVVTLARANRLTYPELDAFIKDRFQVIGRFPGTLGDGEVSVWIDR